MSDIEFTILFTPPFVITADGPWEKEVFYKVPPFPHKLHKKRRSPEDARDKKRSQVFQRSEWIAYTFIVPESILKVASEYIAKEIFENANFAKAMEKESTSKILIENSNATSIRPSVINLSSINIRDLEKKIQEVVTEA